jgi:peroxiredoxin
VNCWDSGLACPALSGERRRAPTFVLPDANGNPVSLAELHGNVVVVNFWATWCGPCKVEIPWFVEFSQSFRGRGLVVLGVSMDEDGWKSVSPFLREHRVNYPVVLGNESLAKAYGDVDSLPSTFIIDKAGRIAIAHTGLFAKATYENEINQLLAEKEPNHEQH